jgi:hypothetical protein
MTRGMKAIAGVAAVGAITYGGFHSGVIETADQAANHPAADSRPLPGGFDLNKVRYDDILGDRVGYTATHDRRKKKSPDAGLLDPPVPSASDKKIREAIKFFHNSETNPMCDPKDPRILRIGQDIMLCVRVDSARAVTNTSAGDDVQALEVNALLYDRTGALPIDMDTTYGQRTKSCIEQRVTLEEWLDRDLAKAIGKGVGVVVSFSDNPGGTTPCNVPGYEGT